MGGQSQFIEMFGERSTTPIKNFIQNSFPGDWGKEDKDGTGIKVIRTTNFTNFGKLNLTEVVTRSVEERKVKKKLIHKYDTILERSGGTNENPVGRVVLFEEEGKFLCNNFTQVLRFENIEPRYAFYALYYFYQTNKTEVRNMGSKTTGIQNLNMNMYLNIGIPNASMNEQQQFVAIAEQSDKSKFVGFKSQFIEMFGNNKWKVTNLDKLCHEWIKGQAFKKDSMSNDGCNKCIHYGELFTKYGPIINEVYSSTDSTIVKASKRGDILFPASDVTPDGLARCSAIMEDNVLLGGDIIALRPNSNISPQYLSWAINMQKEQLLQRVTGSVVRHISAKGLKTVEVVMPPMTQQKQFVAIAEQSDKSKYNEYKS